MNRSFYLSSMEPTSQPGKTPVKFVRRSSAASTVFCSASSTGSPYVAGGTSSTHVRRRRRFAGGSAGLEAENGRGTGGSGNRRVLDELSDTIDGGLNAFCLSSSVTESGLTPSPISSLCLSHSGARGHSNLKFSADNTV